MGAVWHVQPQPPPYLLPLEATSTRITMNSDVLLYVPFSISCLSMGVLLFRSLRIWFRGKLARGERGLDASDNPQASTVPSSLLSETIDNDGITIFSFMVARFIGCLVLVGLSIASIVKHQSSLFAWPVYDEESLLALSLLVVFVYASLLALLAIISRNWREPAVFHNVAVLFATFTIYGYRDLWPLVTYTLFPEDAAEGPLLWAKISTLLVTSVIIPLFIPRKYTPIDPNIVKEPHPEQTASLFSSYIYSYLDPVIFAARRTRHLAADQLPPLADYDRATYLAGRAFRYLDPFRTAKRRHLFFGLMKTFAFDYFSATVSMTVYMLATFVSPLAVNRLLTYLESGGQKATFIRPWFWIVCLFAGPMLSSIGFQSYILAMTRSLVRTEAILTQLVFEHSLRVRIKAETPASPPASGGDVPDETTRNHASTSSESPPTQNSGDKKGKPKSTKPSAEAQSPTQDGTSQNPSRNFSGKLNNLVTIDLSNITGARDLVMLFYLVPVQTLLCMVFLYFLLGWSAFVGLASMVILLPVPGYLAKLMQKVQVQKMAMTDSRVQTVTETMNVLRMIKMFGWESRIKEKIEDRREQELKWIWKDKILELITGLVNHAIPTVTMIVTYATYTIVMKQELTAAIVFSSMTIFDTMRGHLYLVNWSISLVIKGKVSLDRFGQFLHETELLDRYTAQTPAEPLGATQNAESEDIGFRNATFVWSSESNKGASTPSNMPYKLDIQGELVFQRGKINLIIGPTGAGKTSMLMALLGEMHFLPTCPNSWFNLPRSGGVAYAVQESWVQNETIRDNIVFNSPYDENRYKKVLYQCALEPDLKLFEAGDLTEIGERGLTLSGGQKARITLARAIYSDAAIILLDDVLAALDVHTSKWIVNNCLKGDLIKGRTVLLVTHNLALASPIADFIVSIDLDGRVQSQGQDFPAAIASNALLLAEYEKDKEEILDEKELLDGPTEPVKDVRGKLVVAEEIQEGNVSWKAMKVFLNALGGQHVILFFAIWVFGSFLERFVGSLTIWFLGYWSSQYEIRPPGEVPVLWFMGTYVALSAILDIIYSSNSLWYLLGSMRASKTIHRMLTESVFGATMRWLDETPISRVITRATQDIGSIDTALMRNFNWVVGLVVIMAVDLFAAVLFVPFFIIPGIAIAAIGIYAGSLYLKAQLSVKREMSNAKSPMLAHFGAAMAGLVSIRAYGAESTFKAESLKRIDFYVRIARMNSDLNRWIGIRIDLLGGLFTAGLAAYLTYGKGINAANTGFSLNRAIEFSSMILVLVRIANLFQVEANSLERIVAYTEIDQEPKPSEAGKPPAAWPTSGDLRVENLTARYSKTGPPVLHGLTLRIRSGERIGIVGRTGSGKSSLTLSILRCILTEGTVFFDGVATNQINLDALRTNITIIPQMPELLSGTLRYNLDPFDQYDDAMLNDSMRASGLFSLQGEGEGGEGNITLDTNIASGGGNLSVGQRQIIALARAIVRGTKLLILDEATSAIDHQTDTIIQQALRKELGSDVTVLTVAHRLRTIMDADRIMVLDAGHIVEFASPTELLSKEGSFFKALVDESGDRELLYQVAAKAGSSSGAK